MKKQVKELKIHVYDVKVCCQATQIHYKEAHCVDSDVEKCYKAFKIIVNDVKTITLAVMAGHSQFTTLAADEFAQRRLVKQGRKYPIRARLEAMQVNDIVEISRAAIQWKRKSPSPIVRDVEKQIGYQFEIWKDVDRQTWVVRRVS